MSIELAWKILVAIAFEMTSQLVAPKKSTASRRESRSHKVPNFDRVAGSQAEFDLFRRAVFARVRDPDGASYSEFCLDLDRLQAMNEVLEYGLLDTVELTQILWRDRTLQEFLTAYWMSNWCSEADAERLWDWIYQPDVPANRDYYWVWRYATEMPAAAREPQAWVRAMAPLYRPGDGTAEGTKRSCERIYRSWQNVEQFAPSNGHLAHRQQELKSHFRETALAPYWAEFQDQILTGARDEQLPSDPSQTDGKSRGEIAREQQADFRLIPPEAKHVYEEITFTMGSPRGRGAARRGDPSL